MKLVHKGSVKDIYEGNNSDELLFVFSDRISVYDCPIPSEVPHKGEVVGRCAAHWFEVCKDLGIDTHYLGMEDKAMRVKKVAIEADPAKLKGSTKTLVPLECIVRHYIAGSFADRIKKGKVSAEYASMKSGDRMPAPYFEVSTKLEPVDRLIDFEEATRLAALNEGEIETLRDMCLKIDEVMNAQALKNGLIHVDGKKEFGRNEHGGLMVVDVFGTPDEDRFWDAARFEETGEMVDMSKEFVRNHYVEIGFKDAVYEARAKGIEEPKIPPMPESLIRDASEIYIDLYERLTGKTF